MRTIEEAIGYMSESADVKDWNTRRDHVFKEFKGELKELILAIDGVIADEQSLIVRTLGKDDVDEPSND
jgi:hypothetical protein